MKLQVRPMVEEYVSQIVDRHYEEPYSFYNINADPEDAIEFLNFRSSPPDKYFGVIDENEVLVGFFEFTVLKTLRNVLRTVFF